MVLLCQKVYNSLLENLMPTISYLVFVAEREARQIIVQCGVESQFLSVTLRMQSTAVHMRDHGVESTSAVTPLSTMVPGGSNDESLTDGHI